MTSVTHSPHNPSFGVKLLALIAWNALFLIAIALGIVVLFGPIFYPRSIGLYITLPYYTYTLFLRRYELQTGNRWPWFTKDFPFFRLFRTFLGLNFTQPPPEFVDAEKKEDAQFIIACFPHGVTSEYRHLMDGMLDEVMPHTASKCRALAASILFRLPLIREISLWTGCVDASRSVAETVLDKGHSLLVLPGGEAEQIRTICGKEIIYLSKRKGFVKLALRKGVPLVPVYVFGCSDMFYTTQFLIEPRKWLVKHFGICIMPVMGFYCPFCPLPVKTTMCFGKPIEFVIKEKGNPTSEELDGAHKQFCGELTKLFDEHKEQLGYGDRTLEIH